MSSRFHPLLPTSLLITVALGCHTQAPPASAPASVETLVAQAPRKSLPAPVPAATVTGGVLGPVGGLLRDHVGSAISNNGAGLISNNAAGLIANNGANLNAGAKTVLADAPVLEPIAGARVSLVGPIGREVIAYANGTSKADGTFSFEPTRPLPSMVFVRAEFERDGRLVTLYAPVKLPSPGVGQQVLVDPASTLVAKKLQMMAMWRLSLLNDMNAAAVEASVRAIAPLLTPRGIAAAVLSPDEGGARLFDALVKESPELARKLDAVWEGVSGWDLRERSPYPVGYGSSTQVTAPATPVSVRFWSDADVPALSDSGATTGTEVGMRFRSTVHAKVTGVRFYKAATNTGTHVANLWALNGTLLASATFSAETAAGWQEVAFANPVGISANTTYVVSYFAPNGHYAEDTGVFSTTGLSIPPLQAPAQAVVEGNGVFAVAGASTYPATASAGHSNFWVEPVVSYIPGAAGAASSMWGDANSPGVAAYADATAYELGVKFRSTVAGLVKGVRFYKGAGNTGQHLAHLWASDGTRLACGTFTAETATGWQQATFTRPVAIAANTTYVASYFKQGGTYAADHFFFRDLGLTNGSLRFLQDGVDGGNGVFRSGISGFPNSTHKANNYWVDVVFAQEPAPSAPSVTSFWNQTEGPLVPDAGDTSANELGLKFRPQVNGRVTGVRFFKSLANTGTHVGNLWAANGTLLATATFTGETASGWQHVDFGTSVAVTAGTTYVVSYHCPQGHYAATANYFETAFDTGLLLAPASAVGNGNGVYKAGASGFPSSTFNANNYWVDPVFAPGP